jgi:hypothetical protein
MFGIEFSRFNSRSFKFPWLLRRPPRCYLMATSSVFANKENINITICYALLAADNQLLNGKSADPDPTDVDGLPGHPSWPPVVYFLSILDILDSVTAPTVVARFGSGRKADMPNQRVEPRSMPDGSALSLASSHAF